VSGKTFITPFIYSPYQKRGGERIQPSLARRRRISLWEKRRKKGRPRPSVLLLNLFRAAFGDEEEKTPFPEFISPPIGSTQREGKKRGPSLFFRPTLFSRRSRKRRKKGIFTPYLLLHFISISGNVGCEGRRGEKKNILPLTSNLCSSLPARGGERGGEFSFPKLVSNVRSPADVS